MGPPPAAAPAAPPRGRSRRRAAPPGPPLRPGPRPSRSSTPRVTSCDERVPDVEEVEPLGRVLPHDRLEDGDPGPRGILLTVACDGERLPDRHRVSVVRLEQAERRHERDTDGAGQHEGTQGERRGVTEERDRRVPPGAERTVPLDGDDLAAAERGDQLYRDGGAVARDEADPQTVPTHPAIDVSDLLLADHDARRPVGVTRQEPTSELQSRSD